MPARVIDLPPPLKPAWQSGRPSVGGSISSCSRPGTFAWTGEWVRRSPRTAGRTWALMSSQPAPSWWWATSNRSRRRRPSCRTCTWAPASWASPVKGSTRCGRPGGMPCLSMLHIAGAGARVSMFDARSVIDASGTWTRPNPAGADGLLAPGEMEAADRVAHGIPDVLGHDRARYADKITAAVGSGHSALNTPIEPLRLAGDVPGVCVLRIGCKERVKAAFGGEGADALPGRGGRLEPRLGGGWRRRGGGSFPRGPDRPCRGRWLAGRERPRRPSGSARGGRDDRGDRLTPEPGHTARGALVAESVAAICSRHRPVDRPRPALLWHGAPVRHT